MLRMMRFTHLNTSLQNWVAHSFISLVFVRLPLVMTQVIFTKERELLISDCDHNRRLANCMRKNSIFGCDSRSRSRNKNTANVYSITSFQTLIKSASFNTSVLFSRERKPGTASLLHDLHCTKTCTSLIFSQLVSIQLPNSGNA